MSDKRLWPHVAELTKDIADYYMKSGDHEKARFTWKNRSMRKIKYIK